MPEFLTFGDVIAGLKEMPARQYRREGWNGREQYISLQIPSHSSADTLPYFYIFTVQGKRIPWVASQTDMMAEDWYCCGDEGNVHA